MIKLIATDIDQTLVGNANYMPESAIKAIQEALSAGIKVVLASGRPLVGMQEYLDKLGINGADQYAITHNGAMKAAYSTSRKTLCDTPHLKPSKHLARQRC